MLELPISARPPKKILAPPKTLDHIPFFEGGIVTCLFLNLHSFADICARFADICARFALQFLLAPFEYSATDHLGGPTSPVLGKTLEAGKVYVYHIVVTTPGFAIRLGKGQKFM